MKQLLLIIAVAFSALAMHAMPSKILVYGYIEEGDLETLLKNKRTFPIRMDDVTITIHSEGEVVLEKVNRKSGFYSFVLDPGKKYTVAFSAEGYFTKCIDFDVSKAPLTEQETSFKMFTDILLFKEIPLEDSTSITQAAMARCEFDHEKQRMVWDMDYAKIAFDHFMRITAYDPGYSPE